MSTGTGASDLLHAEDSGVDQIVAGKAPVAARSPLQLFWRRFRKDKVALARRHFIVAADPRRRSSPGRSASWSARRRRTRQSTDALDDFGLPSGPEQRAHLRRRPIGRDIFARVLSGAQVSLMVAFIGTGLSVMIGVTMGMIAGFFRGWVDTLIARTIDILLAFPVLLLGLGLASACSTKDGCLGGLLQPGLTVVIAIIVRRELALRRPHHPRPGAVAAREGVRRGVDSLGASNMRIIFREILPNLVAPIIVYTTLFIPANILLEAALSFLGVGVQPPGDLGRDAPDAIGKFDTAWWYMVFPGTALLLTVLAFNLVGDGMQDALNPKSSRSR